MKRQILFFIFLFLTLGLVTGCTATPLEKMMQQHPQMMAPTQAPAQMQAAELVTSEPADPVSEAVPEWQRVATGDGMVSLEIPGDWQSNGSELSWKSPGVKVRFNIYRFRAGPETELDAHLIPGSTVVREQRDFPAGDRMVRRILVKRDNGEDTMKTIESHYFVRRMDGKEIFDFAFFAPSDVELNLVAPVIQHALDSMIWAMID